MALPTNASEVPQHIINSLYDWVSEGEIDYLREVYQTGDLIEIHTIGGGMQIRNFLRDYPDEINMDAHWLDGNWIEIIKRMFHEREGIKPRKQPHEDWVLDMNENGTMTIKIPKEKAVDEE